MSITVNRWRGTLGHIGRPTDSGLRKLTAIYFTVVGRPLPLIHALGGEVGHADGLCVTDDQRLIATGLTTLPPGQYTVGIDFDNVLTEMVADVLHVEGRLKSVLIGGAEPVWADTSILVQPGDGPVVSKEEFL